MYSLYTATFSASRIFWRNTFLAKEAAARDIEVISFFSRTWPPNSALESNFLASSNEISNSSSSTSSTTL